MVQHNLPKPEAIIFDWDNTIADTWIIIHKALNATFKEFGLQEWTLAETKQRVALSMKDAFPKYFGPHTERASKVYRTHYIKLSENLYDLYDDARDMLELANKKNIIVSVVSNKNGEILRREIQGLNLDNYFHRVIGSMDAERDKPYIDPVLLSLQDTDIKLSPHVWFVGDSIVDMECAHNAKCTPILYGEILHPGFMEPFTPKCNVLSHAQLIELINNVT